MVHGFHNRLLHVDLGTGRHRWEETGADRLRAFLGGIGLGTSLLYDFAPPGVEPLAPENPLIFASAPLAGTGLTTTAKYAVVTKSPLTGFIADSLSSSFFALELKAVGVDAVVVTGRAAAPVYLFIDNRGVELRDARHLWGGSAADTETAVRAELGNPTARVASVGTAGENRVRFATISNEGRHAGRGGVGAVMGSKNLKAIALSGNARVSVADADGVAAIAATLRQRSLGEHTAKYREIGTVANLAVFDRLGALPTRNFQQSTFAGADGLSGESLTENSFSRRHGCASCTIRCERLFKSQSGNEQRMEYETLFALGPLCGIEDPEAVLEAARLCDAYGLDSISTGGTWPGPWSARRGGSCRRRVICASARRRRCWPRYRPSRSAGGWAISWPRGPGARRWRWATAPWTGPCRSRGWNCPDTSPGASRPWPWVSP